MSAWFYQAVEISTQLIIPYNNNFPDKFPYSPFFLPLSSPKRIYQHKTPWTITFTVSFRLFFVQIYQSLLKQGERGGRSYRRPPVSISGNTKPIPGCLCAAYQPRLVEFLSLSLSLSLRTFVPISFLFLAWIPSAAGGSIRSRNLALFDIETHVRTHSVPLNYPR